ncbi:exosortase/archaeosortase family protein [Candidatus Woesearchaeota archaeon]|nr:exosortase/archaeosortase family protein [Candidatus Woesearchaeota archaeon]
MPESKKKINVKPVLGKLLSKGSKKPSHSETVIRNFLKKKPDKRIVHPLNLILKHIGSLQFIERSIIFFVIFLVEVLIIKLYVDYGLGTLDLAELLHLPQRFPLLALIVFLIFFFISKYTILELKKLKPFSFRRFGTFLTLNLVCFIAFFLLNKFMATNSITVYQNKWTFLIPWYILGISLTVFLLLAIFDLKYLLNFVWDFKLLALTSLGVGMLFLYLYPVFYRTWGFFSKIVALAVFAMLKLTFPSAQLPDHHVPRLVLPNFRAQIAAQCSGIEGMTLFILLFTIIVIVDWQMINKWKLIPMYILGLAGMLFVNILRIYTIFFIGNVYSVEFAIGLFHSNAGWILFTVYFLIFEYTTYDWLRKKKGVELVNTPG